MMPYKRPGEMPSKWEPGEAVWTYPDFERHLKSKRLLFVSGFFKGRPTSAVVVANMSYSLVTWLIMGGRINLAVQTEAYRKWLRDELLGKQPGWYERGTLLLLTEEAGQRV